MKNKIPGILILAVVIIGLSIVKVFSQSQCVSASALIIGANDTTCNSQTFTSLGPDFDDNNPPIKTITNSCGIYTYLNANWYSFIGDGAVIRIKVFNQNQDFGFLVFDNQTCDTIMVASQCIMYYDLLPHVIDINTVAGHNYLIAVFAINTIYHTMSGSICAYKTNGLPYSYICDVTPVNLTVKSKDIDCFTNYNSVSLSHLNNYAAPVTSCGNSSLDEWWIGTFIATSASTEIFLWGKDKTSASMEVLEGPCSGAMTNAFCIPNTGTTKEQPSWGSMTTIVGKQYYVIVKHTTIGNLGRLCVYNSTSEPTKPTCSTGMSFEDGVGTGWQGNYGGWRLAWTPSCNQFTWDLPNIPTDFSNNRFMITTGTGRDAKIGMIPMVAPGGGNYSFRMGRPNENTGDIGYVEGYSFFVPGDHKMRFHAAAEKMEYCFVVDSTNSGFGYKYSCLMDNPQHNAIQQPYFEVYLYKKATGDTIPCGKYNHWPGDGKSPFYYVGRATDVSGSSGPCFTPWSDVLTELSGYAGQEVCVVFRQKDCSGAFTVPNSPPWDSAEAGSHGVYTYFDTYCIPIAIEQEEFCQGAPNIQLSVPAGFMNYLWDSSQPGIQPPFNQRHVTINNPVVGDTYFVTLTSFSGCVYIESVVLNYIPFVSIKDTIMCISENKILSALITTPANPPYSYNWSTGNTGSSITVSPSVNTTYTVTVTNGKGCFSSQSASVEIKDCILDMNAKNASICIGNCHIINANGFGGTPPYTYTWNTDQSSSEIYVCPSVTSTYTITIKDNSGDTATKSVIITVNSLPNVTLNGDAICIGDSTIVTAGNANTYTWDNNLGKGSVKTIKPTTATIYSVTGTDINGCVNTASILINVNPLPTIVVSNDTITCPGQSIEICATGANTYTWNTGSQSSCMTYTITAVYTHTFYVTGTGISGCRNVASSKIHVYPPTSITATGDTINQGECITITSSGSSTTYTWNTNDTGSAITVCPSVATVYCVTGTDINDCTNMACATVNVLNSIKEISEKDTRLRIFPNPANNNVNIIFNSENSGELIMKILNIGGQIIYSEKTYPFNGKYNKTIDVSAFSEGVYFVQIVNSKSILTRKLVLIK